ncbi:MAG: hypothetical protein JSV94_03610 [Methanobacteriota archaeon]|nr:MAG: hypothetical protein JSV94_03610 [Euryarchaeota archaeon]
MNAMRVISLIVGLLVVSSPTFLLKASNVASLGTINTSSWTIMIYMAADVVDSLPWELDINEMEAASQADGTNVIALVDPPGTGDAMLLKVEHDENLMNSEIISATIDDLGAVIKGGGEVNTGSSTTLKDFIVFGATEFPADNLILVLWGHGSGWRGLCPDGSDLLTLPELRLSLSTAKETLQRGLDMVVLDVCNGATTELAYEICEYADLLVGSELSVPAEGLPYKEILDTLALAPDRFVEDLGEVIVTSYVEWAEYGSANPTAACMVDLRKMIGLTESLDSVSEIGIRFDRLYHPSMASAAYSSEFSDCELLMDFGALSVALCAAGLPLDLRTASLEMALEYTSTIAYYSESHMDQLQDGFTTGLSLYSPVDDDLDDGYLDLRISVTSWTDLSYRLRSDWIAQDNALGPSMTTEDSLDDVDDLPDSAKLVWESDGSLNYTSYEVHIYRMEPHGLVDCQWIISAVPEIRISEIVGSLLVTASACIDDEIYSYHVMNTTLSGQVRLDLITTEGAIAYEDVVDIVLMTQSNDSRLVECRNGSCIEWIVVPDWANIGEMMTLQVVDPESGIVLSEAKIRVSEEDMTIVLDIHIPEKETIDIGFIAGFIAIVILMTGSLALYLRRTKRN